VDAGWRLGQGDLLDNRYRIEESLGAGGSGRVYAAFDEAAGADDPERVAVKIIGEADAARGDARAALELEFSLLARMSHPNLVAALRIGVADFAGTSGPSPAKTNVADFAGRSGGFHHTWPAKSNDKDLDRRCSYLVEELIEGPTLEQARPHLDVADYWIAAHQILEGLAHIHRRGWVHHDIKPANILLEPAGGDSGFPYVARIADLGVAALSGSDPEGRVSGTVPFLSPERLVGKLTDPRSDIWALGMTLLYCLTGALPINTNDVREAARLLRSQRLPGLRDLAPDAPAGLEVVIARMLARDGRTRYRDGAEALDALRAEMEREGLPLGDLAIESAARSPAFVGRDKVVAGVLETLGRGTQRRPRVARVRGAEGSGRSRLLREVALEVQLHGARAVAVPPGEGLIGWRGALARLGGELDAGVADPDTLVDRLVAAMSQQPAVLLIDDVDAAGPVTAHVLDRLAPALAGIAPGFLCGAVVTHLEPAAWQPAEPSWFVDVFLEPLGRVPLEILAVSVLGDSISGVARSALEKIAGGNPQRMLEAIRRGVDSGALHRVAGVWELSGTGLPAAEELGAELLAGIGADPFDLLVAITLLGPASEHVPLQLAREVADLSWDGFSSAAATLRNRDLIRVVVGAERPAGELALATPAVGRAAVACTGDEEIRRRHQRAWLALSRRDDASPAALARHALGAGLVDRALELTREAIAAALARGDYAAVLELTDTGGLRDRGDAAPAIDVARAEALVALSRPLEGGALASKILERDPGNAAAATAATRAALMAGDAHRAARGLDSLLAIAGVSPGERLELAALEVEVCRLNRSPREVAALADRRLAEIDAGPAGAEITAAELARARGRILFAAGTALVYGGTVDRGLELLHRAHALFSDIGDHAHVAHVEGSLAAAADLSGRDEDRKMHLARGLESAARAGSDSAAARLFNIRGLDHLWAGRTSLAVEALAEAERRGRRAGLYKVVSAVTGNLVVVYKRCGLYGRALSAARRSRRIKQPLGDASGMVVTLLNLGDLYCDIGDYRLASGAARRVAREARELGRLRFEIGGRATLAQARMKLGYLAEARAELEWIAANDGGLEHHAKIEVELARAMLDIAERNLVCADERLRDVAAEAERRDEPYFRAWAAYLRGVLLGDVGAEDLRTAVEIASACGARHHLWRARAQLGVVLSAAGELDLASAELARAREVLVEVLDDLPPRHRRTYISTPGRMSLIAAIRAQARFPEPPEVSLARSVAETTMVDVPRAVATLLDSDLAVVDGETVDLTIDPKRSSGRE
jgi:tetratricopeptide (TPR) repeat protein